MRIWLQLPHIPAGPCLGYFVRKDVICVCLDCVEDLTPRQVTRIPWLLYIVISERWNYFCLWLLSPQVLWKPCLFYFVIRERWNYFCLWLLSPQALWKPCLFYVVIRERRNYLCFVTVVTPGAVDALLHYIVIRERCNFCFWLVTWGTLVALCILTGKKRTIVCLLRDWILLPQGHGGPAYFTPLRKTSVWFYDRLGSRYRCQNDPAYGVVEIGTNSH